MEISPGRRTLGGKGLLGVTVCCVVTIPVSKR